MLERLAGFLYRRRRFVLVFAVFAVLLGGVFGGPVFGVLDSSGDFEDPEGESVRARQAIDRATGANATPDVVVLVRLGAPAEGAR